MVDLEEIRRRVEPVLARHAGVGYALVFGSTARGEATTASDADFVVGPSEVDLLALTADLTAALDVQADVVRGESAPIPLLEEILRDGVTVYEREPGAAALFRSRTLTMLETDGPWYRHMRDAFLRRVAERGSAR